MAAEVEIANRPHGLRDEYVETKLAQARAAKHYDDYEARRKADFWQGHG